MSTLLDPFSYDLFTTGLAIAVLSGALCGLLGVYVVLRGMSYIGHGLSHAILGWAVASFVLRLNFYVGAGIGGFLSALMIDRVARRRTLGADAAIGVVTTGAFAFGLALISRFRSFTRSFEAVLFGNVLGVTIADVLIVGGTTVGAALFVFLAYRRLLFATFDPEVAQASGVNTSLQDALYAFVLAAAIVVTMNVIGVLLVVGALVIPPATARLLTNSFARMLWLSIVLGAASGAVGMYASWYANVSSGAAIVLTQVTFFTVAYALSGARARARLPREAHA